MVTAPNLVVVFADFKFLIEQVFYLTQHISDQNSGEMRK